MEPKIPPPLLPRTRIENRTIGHLWLGFRDGPDYENPNLPDGTRFILGLPLPVFQRGLVWTVEQKVRFIESFWNQFHLGVYIVNDLNGTRGVGNVYEHPLQDALVDGQQRPKALEDYWNNQFPVFGHLWKDLPEFDQRRFKSTTFGRGTVDIADEPTLRLAYDLLNFGGVAHEQEERARPDLA